MILRNICQLFLATTLVFLFGACIVQASDLIIHLVQTSGSKVILQWEGLELTQTKECELSYRCNDSTQVKIINDYMPSNNTIELSGLVPEMQYEFFMTCSDTLEGKHNSSVFNFTTAAHGSLIVYTTSTTVLPTTTTRGPSSKALPSSTSTSTLRATTPPDIYQTLPSGSQGRSKVDIGVGIAFGFIGVGVVVVGGYYVIKEYRRKLRIRRFLQYRQQENESFPDIDQEEDEGIVL